MDTGGERKHASVLFSDLSGYTTMVDRLDPEEIREVSSRIFSEIAEIVATYQGFIEKFIGDAVLAIFGLPTVHEDDPVRAVKAAMGIHRVVQSISPEYESRIDQQLRMHNGIHTGLIVTGEMILEKGIHGIVGDPLNLASRLADVAGPGEILVILYRQEGRTSWPDWNFHTPCLLKAMDAPDTAHIIKSISNVKALPDGFASIVHARTGGNPLFIEEVCKTLSEDGSVRIEGRKAALLHPLEQLRLPATVQAVIRARLDRLDSHVKESLQRAAVIGREFSLRLLERICNTKHRLPLSLDMLEAQELIQQSPLVPEAEYMFKHVLTQVAVYESLLLKKRKALHASVGQALEELYANRLEEQCENLAHHCSNSTHREKALFYLEMAATKATRVHSLSEARRYYEDAFSIFEANRLNAESQQKFIDLTLKWAGDLDDRELLAISYNLRGRACLYTCEYSKGIDYLNKGLERVNQ